MDKNSRNRTLGIGLIALGVIGFLLLFLTKKQFFILSGFILPTGILLFLKSIEIEKKRLKTIVVFSFLACLFFAITLNDYYEHNELSEYGVITQGIIIEKKHDGDHRSCGYIITYVFCDQKGNSYNEKKHINALSKYEKGDTIDVIYSLCDADINNFSHKINSKPKAWSFPEAIWKSDMGVKKIIIMVISAIIVIYLLGFILIIGLYAIGWVSSLFHK
jgi:hypothetical protein